MAENFDLSKSELLHAEPAKADSWSELRDNVYSMAKDHSTELLVAGGLAAVSLAGAAALMRSSARGLTTDLAEKGISNLSINSTKVAENSLAEKSLEASKWHYMGPDSVDKLTTVKVGDKIDIYLPEKGPIHYPSSSPIKSDVLAWIGDNVGDNGYRSKFLVTGPGKDTISLNMAGPNVKRMDWLFNIEAK